MLGAGSKLEPYESPFAAVAQAKPLNQSTVCVPAVIVSCAEEKQGRLFRLVSAITGFKNSLKGAGYFLGAATVGVKRVRAICQILAAGLA